MSAFCVTGTVLDTVESVVTRTDETMLSWKSRLELDVEMEICDKVLG